MVSYLEGWVLRIHDFARERFVFGKMWRCEKKHVLIREDDPVIAAENPAKASLDLIAVRMVALKGHYDAENAFHLVEFTRGPDTTITVPVLNHHDPRWMASESNPSMTEVSCFY